MNGDGQSSLFGHRTRDSQNDGTGYSQAFSNDAVRGYNFWGDVYTFGVSVSTTTITHVPAAYWAPSKAEHIGVSGYKSSASLTYGVYGSRAYATGAGRGVAVQQEGFGGGSLAA